MDELRWNILSVCFILLGVVAAYQIFCEATRPQKQESDVTEKDLTQNELTPLELGRELFGRSAYDDVMSPQALRDLDRGTDEHRLMIEAMTDHMIAGRAMGHMEVLDHVLALEQMGIPQLPEIEPVDPGIDNAPGYIDGLVISGCGES